MRSKAKATKACSSQPTMPAPPVKPINERTLQPLAQSSMLNNGAAGGKFQTIHPSKPHPLTHKVLTAFTQMMHYARS